MATSRTIAIVLIVAGECAIVHRGVTRWMARYPTPTETTISRAVETRRAVPSLRPLPAKAPRRKVWCAEMPNVELWCPTAERLPE